MTEGSQTTSEVQIDLLDALERWYGQDNEDWISLRRSEVGRLLEEIGRKPR